MRLNDLYTEMKKFFPDLDPQISSKVVDGKEVVQVDFKVTMNVNFEIDAIDESTINEDVANTVRQGLYALLMKSSPKFDQPPVVQDEGVEEVADEDRKIVLPNGEDK